MENEFVVKEGDKEQTVIIKGTEAEMKDKSYMAYLKEAQIEKTKKELKDKPSKPKSTKSKEEIAGAIKEYQEFVKRQKTDHPKKFY